MAFNTRGSVFGKYEISNGECGGNLGPKTQGFSTMYNKEQVGKAIATFIPSASDVKFNLVEQLTVFPIISR
jgi:hypothetical protein